MDKKQTPTDKASKEDTPKVEKVKDTNNGQVPVRGGEASDEEAMAHAEEVLRQLPAWPIAGTMTYVYRTRKQAMRKIVVVSLSLSIGFCAQGLAQCLAY